MVGSWQSSSASRRHCDVAARVHSTPTCSPFPFARPSGAGSCHSVRQAMWQGGATPCPLHTQTSLANLIFQLCHTHGTSLPPTGPPLTAGEWERWGAHIPKSQLGLPSPHSAGGSERHNPPSIRQRQRYSVGGMSQLYSRGQAKTDGGVASRKPSRMPPWPLHAQSPPSNLILQPACSPPFPFAGARGWGRVVSSLEDEVGWRV